MSIYINILHDFERFFFHDIRVFRNEYKIDSVANIGIEQFSSSKKVTSIVTRSGDHWFKG